MKGRTIVSRRHLLKRTGVTLIKSNKPWASLPTAAGAHLHSAWMGSWRLNRWIIRQEIPLRDILKKKIGVQCATWESRTKDACEEKWLGRRLLLNEKGRETFIMKTLPKRPSLTGLFFALPQSLFNNKKGLLWSLKERVVFCRLMWLLLKSKTIFPRV